MEHKVIYLKDYTPPPYLIETVHLEVELHALKTRVLSTLQCRKNPESTDTTADWRLYGEELVLGQVSLNGRLLEKGNYDLCAGDLCLKNLPGNSFELIIETNINPKENTALEGLYLSSGNFCTQCEAEGFRRITYFPDRPDVMAEFTTKVIGDKDACPVLLANGNLIETGELDANRHYAIWHDPFKKPSYLFALVAGDLVCIKDTFQTMSGREVDLHIYVEKRNEEKCKHAMRSLQKAMAWDEEKFGREYDLDIYMIVAVDDFNMGAMENKGLNVFNSKYVLAQPETATDQDYDGIEGVIGHEYFHNWTGNRITCRDWFQLSLKEGLTVFRDQEFTSDMTSSSVKRVNDVRVMRNFQFREDAGPMAHPVRPDSYMEINNFYTLTVYNKGAEVIRMIHLLLGAEGFRRGMDLYFKSYDGQAVTCDDFVAAMAEGGPFDFSSFRRWYSQAGTPKLHVETEYDQHKNTFSFTVSQTCPDTPGQNNKEPFYIPIEVGLLDNQGKDMALALEGESPENTETSKILHLQDAQQYFVFQNISEKPVVSFLRNFSAPVIHDLAYKEDELAFLIAHDSDLFNRWDAMQQLSVQYMLVQIKNQQRGKPVSVPILFIETMKSLLQDDTIEPAFKALALDLPQESWLGQQMEVVDPLTIFEVRRMFRSQIGHQLSTELKEVYFKNNYNEPYCYDSERAGKRGLKNICLDYLLAALHLAGSNHSNLEIGLRQYGEANNMTDVFSALKAIVNVNREEGERLLADFYEKWQHDPLVMDKWLALQATCELPGTLERVISLQQHPAFNFKNPNKVRALISTFCALNQSQFHAVDGSGYTFLADFVLKLNTINPQIAARLLTPLTTWKRFDGERQGLMQAELLRIQQQDDLSKDVSEVVSKSLAQ